MSTYEIGFYIVMGLASVAASLWALRSSATSDPSPPRAFHALSLALWMLSAVVFLRLFGAWTDLGEGWRLLAAIAIGLFSTAAALAIVLARRGRQSRAGLQTS